VRLLSIDVFVIVNGSELGEYILRKTWEAAQRIFKEYGIKVFVIPYYSVKAPVSIIINGVEYVIHRKLSFKELMNMILSAAPLSSGSEEGEVAAIGLWGHSEDRSLGNAETVE